MIIFACFKNPDPGVNLEMLHHLDHPNLHITNFQWPSHFFIWVLTLLLTPQTSKQVGLNTHMRFHIAIGWWQKMYPTGFQCPTLSPKFRASNSLQRSHPFTTLRNKVLNSKKRIQQFQEKPHHLTKSILSHNMARRSVSFFSTIDSTVDWPVDAEKHLPRKLQCLNINYPNCLSPQSWTAGT